MTESQVIVAKLGCFLVRNPETAFIRTHLGWKVIGHRRVKQANEKNIVSIGGKDFFSRRKSQLLSRRHFSSLIGSRHHSASASRQLTLPHHFRNWVLDERSRPARLTIHTLGVTEFVMVARYSDYRNHLSDFSQSSPNARGQVKFGSVFIEQIARNQH